MGVFALQTQEYSDFFDKKVRGRRQNNETSGYYSIGNRLKDLSYLSALNSKDPQAVMKIISSALGKRQINNVMDYICREKEEEKLACEDDQGRVFSGKEERQQLLKEWEKDFLSKESYDKQAWKLEELHKMEERFERLGYKKEKGTITKTELSDLAHLEECISEKFTYNKDGKKVDLKMRGVADTTHILFSVGSKPDLKKATEATRSFLQENFKAVGFRYIMVTHNDTDNLHFHVVVHNRNLLEKTQRLYFDKSDLFVLRKEYAKHLKSFGIKRESTLRKDRPNILESIKDGVERLYERKSWFQSKVIDSDKSNKNVYVAKSALLKQVQNSIKKIEYELKKTNIIEGQKLKKYLKEVREIKADITKSSQVSIDKIRKDAIKYFLKQDKALANKLKSTSGTSFINDKNSHMAEFLRNHNKELKLARDYIVKNTKITSSQERKALKESLNTLTQLIKNTKTKEIGV